MTAYVIVDIEIIDPEGYKESGQSHLNFDALYMDIIAIFSPCRQNTENHI